MAVSIPDAFPLARKQKSDGARSPECWQVLQQAVFALVSVNRSLGGGIKHRARGFSLCAISWEGSTDVPHRTPVKFKDAKLLGWL